jgi:hypothetical protein
MTLSATYRPLAIGPARSINWKWLLQRAPMIALALLSSWGVGGFILQSGRANLVVAIVGAGAFDLVFLGVIALADQLLTIKRSTHMLYWVLNIGAAFVAALMNTLYYSGGTYSGITAESVTHGALFAIFGLLYSLYYHGVMSEALEKEDEQAREDAARVQCPHCGEWRKNQPSLYRHYRECPKHPSRA